MTDQHGEHDPGETPHTSVFESDPNADAPEGLFGEMGVSSGWSGPVRGGDADVTYGAARTDRLAEQDDSEESDPPPEQSAYDGQPEVHPDQPAPHEFDPGSNPGHGL